MPDPNILVVLAGRARWHDVRTQHAARSTQHAARSTGPLALAFIALLLALGTAACAPRDGAREGDLEERAHGVVTDLVPTSDICNVGQRPKECISTPPVASSAFSRFAVDGAMDPLEYAHAVQIPFVEQSLKATATVFVQAAAARPRSLKGAPGNLFLYFSGIPFRTEDVSFAKELTLQVYIDRKRFTGSTFCFEPEDTGHHDGSTAPPSYHYFVADLWDADDTSSDDLLSHDRGQALFWDLAAIALIRDSDRAPLHAYTLNDNFGWQQCTNPGPTNVCFMTVPTELAPGQQF